MQRVLRGTSATISVTWLDSEGSAASAPGPVTVGVTRADGSEVVAPGTATTAGPGVGQYTFTLTAAQTALLDELSAVWSAGGSTRTTTIEVVGGYYFSVAEARSTDASLADPARYPTAEVVAARTEVEEEFERICAVSFVPRFRRAEVRGRLLPDPLIRTLRSVTVGNVAYTTDQVAAVAADRAGVVRLPSGAVVGYEHGWDAPPADLRRAAITRLRSRLNAAKSAIPDRAASFTVAEGGTYRLNTAGENKTGIDDIDAVLAGYHHRYPAVG